MPQAFPPPNPGPYGNPNRRPRRGAFHLWESVKPPGDTSSGPPVRSHVCAAKCAFGTHRVTLTMDAVGYVDMDIDPCSPEADALAKIAGKPACEEEIGATLEGAYAVFSTGSDFSAPVNWEWPQIEDAVKLVGQDAVTWIYEAKKEGYRIMREKHEEQQQGAEREYVERYGGTGIPQTDEQVVADDGPLYPGVDPDRARGLGE